MASKKLLVVDAQGGGIGKQVIAEVKRKELPVEIFGAGTNSVAVQAMHKAGADHAVTGENAVIVCSRTADYIIGPIGIVIADAMYGEITPAMACAVGQSRAEKMLIPVNHCSNYITGISGNSIRNMITEAVERLERMLNEQGDGPDI